MTPIINPWVFYFASVSTGVILVTTFILVVGVIILAKYLFDQYNFGDKINPKFVKMMSTIIIVSGVIAIFTPSQKTITKMVIAQNVTYERVEVATDTVETVYNDIMELFDKEGADE